MEDKKKELIKKYKNKSKYLFEEHIEEIEKNVYSAYKEGLNHKTIREVFFTYDVHCEYDEYVDVVIDMIENFLLNKYAVYWTEDLIAEIVAARSGLEEKDTYKETK